MGSSSDSDDSPPQRHPPTRTNRLAAKNTNLENLNIPNSCVYTSRINKLSEIKKLNIEKMLASNDVECAAPPGKRYSKRKANSSVSGNNDNPKNICNYEISDRSPSPPPETISEVKQLNQSSKKILNKYHQVLKQVTSNNDTKNLHFESDEDEYIEYEFDKDIAVKIRWKMEIIKFNIKFTDEFSTVISKLSNKICVPFNSILLSKGDATIHPQDTPHSIGLTIADILDCLIVEPIEDSIEDNITLKLQANLKSKVALTIKKTDPFSVLIDLYAKKKELPSSSIILKFDGDVLDSSDTPEDLGLEEDECIDVILGEVH